ncbi:MAG: pantoate--beta-alanine ligase [Xanthomonadales bacterium]|jgi:pantoate--beta-alanine ligase|nr:pantoate--beta-alanine ligase [Xanthomonadales bacterium]
MIVHREIEDWQKHRRNEEAGGAWSAGFVPTLGGLHAGHGSLIARSRQENPATVVSVFLNPAQFDQQADLDQYPAELEKDLAQLDAWGVDHVLLPTAEAMYPDDYRYRVTENDVSRRFCGAHRPGHFDGVLTVVLKLLNLVRPRRAYFGEKDWQQLSLVRDMASAFFLDLEIVACPVVREESGLALSSRNARLDARQRALAPELLRSLRTESTPEAAARRLQSLGFEVDYVADHDGRRLAAARLGEVRLIDNISLDAAPNGPGKESAHAS